MGGGEVLEPVLFVDVSSLAWRAFHRNPREEAGLLSGFLDLLPDVQKMAGTKRTLFVHDNGIPGRGEQLVLWRKALLPTYKGNRTDTAEKREERRRMQAQLKILVTLLDAAGYGQLGIPGVEADDIISILAGKISRLPKRICGDVVIYSGDFDFCALLSETVRLIRPSMIGGLEWCTPKDLEEKYGVSPEWYPFYKALVGDSSDCVKGLPGCGPKKALELISAGADPRYTWAEQFPEVQAFEKFAELWPEALQSYAVTAMPTRAGDVRGREKETDAAIFSAQAFFLTKPLSKRDDGPLVALLREHHLGSLLPKRWNLISEYSKPWPLPTE